MAIKSFKDIINNKGYRINKSDRDLFDKGDIQSFFGFSENDCIEFKLYDVNNNELPVSGQFTAYGNVKYIPLTNENIKDYFLIAEGTIFQKYQFPTEYFIDAERLIKESGYNNGIFKVEITLLNKRVGGEQYGNKLWVSEISPSRLEVRLFPVENNNSAFIQDLKERYGIFYNNGEFKEDTLKYAIPAIEAIDANYIGKALKNKYSEQWFNTFLSEYKVNGFDIFCTEIYNTFVQACTYEFTNRVSDVNSLQYGKPKTVKPSISLSKDNIINACRAVLTQVLNKYLINPTPQFGNSVIDNLESYDATQQILQSKTSDTIITTNTPTVKEAVQIKTSPVKVQLEKIKTDLIAKNLPIPKEIILPDVPINTPISEPVVREIQDIIPKRYIIEDKRVNPSDPFGYMPGGRDVIMERESIRALE
jgi:hypothetical protein